MTMLVT
jgi:hypothetical protein